MICTTKEKLEHLSSSIYNFICDYRKYDNWYFYDKEIPDLESVKKILNDEDKGIDFMTDLSEMFGHLSMYKNFKDPQEEKFFDTLFSIFKEYNDFIYSYDKENDIDSLAIDLVDYMKEVNLYEYNDVYENDDHAFNDMKKSLSTTSGVDTLVESLCNDINDFVSENDLSNNNILNNFNNASNLLVKLNYYSKTLKKEVTKDINL